MMEGPGTARGIVRIEVAGFKSFAERVELPLLDGITAVVGPNGTGKSNLVDAVRWALGEQRPRPLRVERMEDVLYAGSERRRPAGLAECSLTLANEGDRLGLGGAEVEVCRRLYRSGESAYLVNRRPARLRDIDGVMRRAGLASDGYGIVSQGRVDEVLRARPPERLRMVEEAAGIGALEGERNRAVAALGEGAAERARLESRRDELAHRVAELAGQAARAERDRVLGEAIRAFEMALAERERRRLERRRDALRTAVAEARDDLATIDREEAEARRLASDLATLARAGRDGSEALRAGMERLAAAAAEWRSRAQAARERAVDALRARREAEEALAKARQRAERAGADAASWRGRLPALSAASAAATEAAAARGAADGGAGRVAAHNAAARRAAEADESRAVLARHRDEVRVRESEAAAALAAASEGREAARAALAEAEGARARAATALQAAQANWQAAREHLLEGRAQRSAGRAPQGAEQVLRAAEDGALSGVYGLLGDLVSAEPGLEMAISAALGGAALDLVTATAAEAERAVAWLRRHGGRATFLPLDHLVVRESRRPPATQGVLGVAAELVRYEPAMEKAVLQRLGGVWVVETLRLAMAVGRSTGMRQRIVTLDGDVVAPGGAITGGSARPARLGRATADLRTLGRAAEEAQAVVRAAESEADWLGREAARHGEALVEAERQLAHAQARVAMVGERVREVEAALAAADAACADAEGALAALSPVPSETSPEAALAGPAALDRAAAAAAALGEARGAMAAAEAEGRRAQAEARSLEMRIAALRPGPDGGEAEAAERRAQALGRLLDALRAQAGRRRRIGAAVGALAASARLVAERLAGARATGRERLDGRARELVAAQEALDAATAGLLQAFGPDALSEAARHNAETRGDEAGLAARLSDRRRERGELGPVWAGAQVAHADAASRLAALDEELEGLEAGRRALLALAEQARRRMDRAVADTLGAVREGFAATVAELLGGRGEVVEVGEGEQGAGVELGIALPGKRTAALAALSGGERALGALAFLFSLLAVRPSALVLLDEVEAALDPANVGRFARHLRRAAARQQFMVITHQRATMEAAHALWGFTAQEVGASHLVTVRLDDPEADAQGVAG